MLERVSVLAEKLPFETEGLRATLVPDFELTQWAGDVKALGRIPDRVGIAIETKGVTLLRVASHQFWVIGKSPEAPDGVFVTPLSSSRCCVLLEGHRVRDVLAKCAAIDFHPTEFRPGMFVMTGIHHMPVMIRCVGDSAFRLYAMRTFARALWDVVRDGTV
jgi:methylglutamate dehydrogenase subunit D